MIVQILPFLSFNSRRQCLPRLRAPHGQVLSLARDGRHRESASSGGGDYRGEEDEEAKGASVFICAFGDRVSTAVENIFADLSLTLVTVYSSLVFLMHSY